VTARGISSSNHTGVSLYDGYINLRGTGNNGYQAYSIDNSNGKITFVNQVVGGPEFGLVLCFIGNNVYGSSSSSYHFTPIIYGFKRNSNGGLTELNINPPFPTSPSGDFYCPYLAAADPASQVAIAVQPYAGFGNAAGPTNWQPIRQTVPGISARSARIRTCRK
jgi:hypothetical protein